VAVTYTLSLRGPEGLLLDLGGLVRHYNQTTESHCVVALRGKVKGEQSDRCHLLPCCLVTASGIDVKRWLHDIITAKRELGQTHGPAILDVKGKILSTSDLDLRLVTILEVLHDECTDLFPAIIKINKDEIGTNFQVCRSLRRSSDTSAIEKNVSRNEIDTVNRWHGTEQAMGARPNRPMYQHNAQVDILITIC
jgi:hypothetical protein